MDRLRVAIVIPAWNEAATISDVVMSAHAFGIPIVINDGSTDATAQLAAEVGAEVVTHSVNRGYDVALNSGFQRARELNCEVIITLDADGQHDPTLIAKFTEAIEAGADCVAGVRHRKQRFTERLFAIYTRLAFGIDDPLCGMKAYRTKVYLALGHFDSYRSIGTELLLYAAKHDFRVAQIEFQVRDRVGKPRFGQMLRGNYKILRAMLVAIINRR